MQTIIKSKLKIIIFCITFVLCTGYFYPQAICLAQAEKSVNIQEQQLRKVRMLMEKMTMQEKIAQMILVTAPDNAADVQKDYQFGGYVLFANDFADKTTASFQAEQ